ncbi:SHC-transforming protein 4-like isoform X2 [Corythoichthys intestinalis]|uniref:SHC-transforming protein 4-like isoform X2 n=1 Tax=Corythoichthys intestinalis TaxID=161448 RepID=UPI0025A632F1|nr:SHC-transforming protein 4-like isoform X2 [Corythoichthys intestinalis]
MGYPKLESVNTCVPSTDFTKKLHSRAPSSGSLRSESVNRHPEIGEQFGVTNPPKRPITIHRTCSFPGTEASPSCILHQCKQGSSLVHRVVHHHMKYMGSVEVTQPMRVLDFDTRKLVTREAINRLCKRTTDKNASKTKSPEHKQLSCVLGRNNLQFSGRRVILSVSADTLTLLAASSQKITQHSIQAISFASGGDQDMENYIAYVAKDQVNQRACHILECPQGRAAEVIRSIGWAFESRFTQLLCHMPSLVCADLRSADRICCAWSREETLTEQKAAQENNRDVTSERYHYYNVTPKKGFEDTRVTTVEKVGSSAAVSLYENCSIAQETDEQSTDPLDCETRCNQYSACERRDLIHEEAWFHGRLERERAESLLTHNGDFLVRESSSARGQYVLSGMDGTTVRHLLLIDPHGQVRTSDQVFLSVGHLVRFHLHSQIPIVTGSSKLCLKTPILHRH